jgi:hypothetical protein
LGEDARAEGRSTYVPFVRGRQFAAVQAATAKRVDLGLRLPHRPTTPAKALGSATHKVSLTDVDQVDGGVEALLLAAYEQNA